MIQVYLFNHTRWEENPLNIYTERIDQLEGYEDKRLARIFNNTDDFFNGMEVDISSYVTPMFTQNSPMSVENTTLAIKLGTNSIDDVAQMRFINDLNYVNRF